MTINPDKILQRLPLFAHSRTLHFRYVFRKVFSSKGEKFSWRDRSFQPNFLHGSPFHVGEKEWEDEPQESSAKGHFTISHKSEAINWWIIIEYCFHICLWLVNLLLLTSDLWLIVESLKVSRLPLKKRFFYVFQFRISIYASIAIFHSIFIIFYLTSLLVCVRKTLGCHSTLVLRLINDEGRTIFRILE